MKRFLLWIVLLATGVAHPIYAQEQSKMNSVVVTATRVPSIFLETPRTLTVLEKEEIEALPVSTVQELLSYAIGADLRQRGPFGVQADIRLRGASFEQTLILINGIKVNDSQTGHHSLNLPLNLNDIERLDVLRGPASAVFGANAVGGVVNIITRAESAKGISLKGSFGDHQLASGELSIGLPLGTVRQRLSLSQSRSDGYRYNTDFDLRTVSYLAELPVFGHSVSVTSGYTDKQFGANGFYTAAFPDQWERTKTGFVALSSEIAAKRVSIVPRLSWRRNIDDFLLKRTDPDFYHNHHQTDNLSAELQATVDSRLGKSVLGAEWNGTIIESTNLGNHRRQNAGLYLQQQIALGARLRLTPALYGFWYSDWGWQAWPGMNVGFSVTENLFAYASANRAFRVPTYTELYYHSPANAGDPNLRPEKSTTYEAGLKWRRSGWEGSVAVFQRYGRNLIDWVQETGSSVWSARNFTEVNTHGVEWSLWVYPWQLLGTGPITRVHLSYAYLQSNKKAKAFQSKYVLDYLKHQLLTGVEFRWLKGLHQTVQLRYKERIDQKGTLLVDSKLTLTLGRYQLFVEGTNLTNREHFDIGSVPLPGRWLRAGLMVNAF